MIEIEKKKESKEEKVEAECSKCSGTGVYIGFTEPKGEGVVCLKCGGTGKETIKYIPFKERKIRDDVKIVRLSKGVSLTNHADDSIGGAISYEDYLTGKMPPGRNQKGQNSD